MQPATQHFLTELSRSTEIKHAAIADNCRFDERVTKERWTKLENLLENEVIDLKDWETNTYSNYERYVTVPRLSVPDTCLNINEKAWLTNIVTNRSFVRVENLTRFFEKTNLSFETLQDLLINKKDKQALLETHFETWNLNRDARPCFAAFYDEVQAESDHNDWQHQLRDRLGLAHYSVETEQEKIPVALMMYSLDEVLQAVKLNNQSAKPDNKIANPFALPTVLDGGMHEYFFPTPHGHPYGATVHLSEHEQLTAEILHYPIDYQVKHLIKIAKITKPHTIKTNVALIQARDLHLQALREASERADFAEMLGGRK